MSGRGCRSSSWHRITNAVAEEIKSKVMSIKRQSSGFANREHFKTVIYFYCGNLQLDPLKNRVEGGFKLQVQALGPV